MKRSTPSWSAVILPFALILGLVLLWGESAGAQAPTLQGKLGLDALQSTVFTYQGRLIDTGSPANGTYDFEFKLYDAPDAGNLIGTQPRENVDVTDGLFTVVLDFGAQAFSGDARYLEISVRPGSSSGGYSSLAPRQALTPAPYALYAGSTSWSGLTGVPDGFSDNSDDIDDTVSWSEISGIVGRGSDQVASGGHAHEDYYTQYELQADGQASIHWGNLTSVPAGLADGDDDILAGLACSDGQIPKWNGSSWVCGSDIGGLGGGDPGCCWSLIGNLGTTPELNFLGTIDDVAFEIRVSNQRALRIEPAHNRNFGFSPNLIGGHRNNSASLGVVGATIGGGGGSGGGDCISNQVSASFGTVGGGIGNTASGGGATVGGGDCNVASGTLATVSGGRGNTASGEFASVGGGLENTAGGDAADGLSPGTGTFATVSGGRKNTASDDYATVGGGKENIASRLYATVGGGHGNVADADYATIGGGGPSSCTTCTPITAPFNSNHVTDDYGTISGGGGNLAGNGNDHGKRDDARYATVGGGEANLAFNKYTTVGGGKANIASGEYATVGGGRLNHALADYTTIAGGGAITATETITPNRATDDYGTIGGGAGNLAGNHDSDPDDAPYATLGGGQMNEASSTHATASGGKQNKASGVYATVGGGESNTAGPDDAADGDTAGGGHAVVGGGKGNKAAGQFATVFGGEENVASSGATIGGGQMNKAGVNATVAGGNQNKATGRLASIGGGEMNRAGPPDNGGADGGLAATIGGGSANIANGNYATIAGGKANVAEGDSTTVGGGEENKALGSYATTPGGQGNSARGEYSFAAGRQAQAVHRGAFVWADASGQDFASSRENEFAVRATGGVTLVTEIGSSGAIVSAARLAPGSGSWDILSDREAKTNFVPVDGRDVLTRLVSIPISTWNYKTQEPTIRHIGPVAQDFYAAFRLGEDDRHISAVDTDGVALAAIQGLYQIVQTQEAQIEALNDANAALRAENDAQQQRIGALEDRVTALEQAVETGNPSQSVQARGDRIPGANSSVGWFLSGLLLAGVVLERRRRAGSRQ